jgi:Outer membrane protein beta-barrel domain
MKKIIFILFLLVVCVQFSAIAQKTRVGVTAGITTSNMRGTVDGKKIEGDSKTGFAAGFLVDAPINSHLSFQPSLLYVQKGLITQKPLGLTQKDRKSTELRYTDLTLNVLYNTNGKSGNFFIGAGPYVSFNLPSKFLTKSPGDQQSETDITFGNTIAETYRGVDFGANGVMGYRLKGGFFVSANYSLGLRNLIPEGSLSTGDTKNSYIGLSLGWLVNNK